MPYPIRKNKELYKEVSQKIEQDLSSLIPFLNNPYSLLQSIIFNDRDKETIKNIWLTSDVKDDKSIVVSSSVPIRELDELKYKGLIKYIDKGNAVIAFTDQGSKLLRESILNDETSAFTKKASKQLVSENSFDFGNEVLVRVGNPEKFGTRYLVIAKNKLKDKKAKAKTIDGYDNIAVKKANGEYKGIEEYSDDELVSVLHLAKRIIDNQHNIIIGGKNLEHVPINRIKSFAEMIMKELNSR